MSFPGQGHVIVFISLLLFFFLYLLFFLSFLELPFACSYISGVPPSTGTHSVSLFLFPHCLAAHGTTGQRALIGGK